MSRGMSLPILSACVLLTWTAVASASLDVKVAVEPDTVAQCSLGHFLFAVANKGTEPECSVIHFQLTVNGNPLGTGWSRVLCLPAGGRRTFKHDFPVLPNSPLGDYALKVVALSRDSTKSASEADFVVVKGTCGPPAAPGLAAPEQIGQGIASALGMTPDTPEPARRSTWGELRQMYR